MTLNLEAIKARCEKATAGPWYGYEERESSAEGHAVSTGPSNLFTIGISNQDANDADFIAHARTDIPALVAEVERLQSALAAARAALDGERERALTEAANDLDDHADTLRLAREDGAFIAGVRSSIAALRSRAAESKASRGGEGKP